MVDGSGIEPTGHTITPVPDPIEATRYHSLCVRESDLPSELEITARADDGTIMGLRHRELAVEGVQFHPESVLTLEGARLLANVIGVPQPSAASAASSASS